MASTPRLALEVEGWLELGLPDRAIARLAPLLTDPAMRQKGLALQVEALIALRRHQEALTDLAELRSKAYEPDWTDLKEAWCRKRSNDLPGAMACMDRLISRSPRLGIAHYNLACYLALSGKAEQAIHELTLACGLDPRYRVAAKTEPDLVSLGEDARFRELLLP